MTLRRALLYGLAAATALAALYLVLDEADDTALQHRQKRHAAGESDLGRKNF